MTETSTFSIYRITAGGDRKILSDDGGYNSFPIPEDDNLTEEFLRIVRESGVAVMEGDSLHVEFSGSGRTY